jgi:hypothetical protein
VYRLHRHCRACGFGKPEIPTLKESTAAGPKASGASGLIPVLDLGIQPLANDFKTAEADQAGYAPLQVMFCPECTLAQLSVTVDPGVLYHDYPYVTSPSATMKEHFKTLLQIIYDEQQEAGLDCNALSMLEIGSNDGAFLEFSKASIVQGIDPARNLVEAANKRGIPTICDVFDNESAVDALTQSPKGYDVIVARHVFCHVDDWRAFIKALEPVSKKETLICIEVPYVADLISAGQFDTIYHEHTSYMSVRAMNALLKNSAFFLSGVKRLTVHGGAILLLLRRNDFVNEPSNCVCQWPEAITLESWKSFAMQTQAKIKELSSFVRSLETNGKRVVGYGASAKSTVWISACNFSRKEIAYITDTTAQKMYKLSPGTNIPIVDEGALTRDLPDYAVCWAWNYFPEIFEKEKIFREKGGKWILPHPTLQVI